MELVRNWIGERLPISGPGLKELTNEPVPYHLKRWWFALGGTPAYLFFVQIFTGILLAFYYEASPAVAYESVDFITREVAFGWFIRSVHKWAATLMIAAVIARLLSSMLYGVSALDPWAFTVAPLILAAVSLIATYLPARRAAKVDPMVALRYQ